MSDRTDVTDRNGYQPASDTGYWRRVARMGGALNADHVEHLLDEIDRLRAREAELIEGGEALLSAYPRRYCNCATTEPLGAGLCHPCRAIDRWASLTTTNLPTVAGS